MKTSPRKWEWLIPGIIAILQHGTPEAKKQAEEDLVELARKVDALNKRKKVA